MIFEEKLFQNGNAGEIYQFIRDNPHNAEFKKFLENLWKKSHPFLDKNFTEKMKTEFRQRTWEIYLACVLQKHGLNLIPKQKDDGPDFEIKFGKQIIYVEATVADRGNTQDAVPEIKEGLQHSTIDAVDNPRILRIRNSIGKKYKKYQKSSKEKYKKYQENPFVIAVNGYEIYGCFRSDHLILKVVFSAGNLTFPVKPNGNLGNPFYARQEKIFKKDGAPVSTNIFEDENYSNLSAVIFCGWDVQSLFDNEKEMGTSLITVHNPMAKNPMAKGLFKFGEEKYKDTHGKIKSTVWQKSA